MRFCNASNGSSLAVGQLIPAGPGKMAAHAVLGAGSWHCHVPGADAGHGGLHRKASATPHIQPVYGGAAAAAGACTAAADSHAAVTEAFATSQPAIPWHSAGSCELTVGIGLPMHCWVDSSGRFHCTTAVAPAAGTPTAVCSAVPGTTVGGGSTIITTNRTTRTSITSQRPHPGYPSDRRNSWPSTTAQTTCTRWSSS